MLTRGEIAFGSLCCRLVAVRSRRAAGVPAGKRRSYSGAGSGRARPDMRQLAAQFAARDFEFITLCRFIHNSGVVPK